nr:hypothetical protein [Tanacetum cinerariifolium]
MYPAVAWVALLTEGSGQAEYRDKTRNISLKEITDTKGPVPIQFDLRDKQTVMPLGDHAAHWSSYIGEVIRGVPLYYPSWLKVPNERKAALITYIGAAHGIPRLDRDQRGHPSALVKGVQYQQGCFQGPALGYRPHDRDLQCREDQAGTCRPQPLRSTRRSLTHSSWHTLLTGNSFGMRTDEEMRRLEAMGTYTDDEINRLARGGKQRGHIVGVGRVLPARATASPNTNPSPLIEDLKVLWDQKGVETIDVASGQKDPPKEFGHDEILENRKKFCQFIKGVKLPDGFGSCFKHKVTDNDTNITGLKSHDCHIMMQHLLPYGLENYLPDKIAKPIIDLCSLFKQICSATLMEDDMLKAQIKVVDILCDLELIYPPALFDIMIHLVIHLPLEALEGGPISPRCMYPFERYMKKLKGYVRNKAKPKGSIAEGYVAEEALTYSCHYFWDVTTKFNRPDRNVDPSLPTC